MGRGVGGGGGREPPLKRGAVTTQKTPLLTEYLLQSLGLRGDREMRTSKITILAPMVAVALACLSAGGQTPSVSLQQALDRPIDALTVENAPISEVFRRLSEKSGVKFVVDDQTRACLPYGDQTRLDVRMKNATIRKDLSRVLAPEALQWTIENDMVRIVPSEALARMCRRASYDELL